MPAPVGFSVRLDDKSKRIAKRLEKILPEREINAGMNRVVKRELKRVRAEAVKEAASATPLKQKFIRAWSGVDAVQKGSGAVWMVARNIRLDRAGQVTGRGGNVKARGRILSQVIVAKDGTFIIGKDALRRDTSSGRLRHYWLATRETLAKAYQKVYHRAPRELDRALRKEMLYRLRKWRDKVKR